MANLIYAENNIGCALDWPSQDYWYGRESYMSSYYADLEPNTTYTIKRIDTSTRFRLGLSAQDLKHLSSSSASSVTRPFAWTRQVDSSDTVTFTTDATAIHMVIYYTNNSEYNTRVMLNEGSSIEPYTAPTRCFKDHWRLINGELVRDSMPEPLEYLTPPYPASMWRLDSDNDLVTSLLPEPSPIFTPPYPATMWYLDENNKLINGLLPDILPLGAFALTTELQEIRLPESLEEIGREAFYGSAIRRVTIPNNQCTYYATSFPPDCVVTGGHLIE